MSFNDTMNAALAAPLNAAHVKSRSKGSSNLSYIESHLAIREANRIFGFDGWVRETVDTRLVQEEQKKGNSGAEQWYVGYVAKVRITAHGVVRDGTGFGQGIDRDLGNAHESAIKEAESDAMKRALMTFGDPFGLALYDKKQEHVEKPGQAPKAPVAATATGAVAAGTTPAPQNEDGKNAFGYSPARWPVPQMFSEPATESQSKMSRAKARERMLDLDELDVVRRLVLAAYELEDHGSKAAMSLFIDWLINANDETLDRATAASEAEPRPELELS
jgi:DNA repair and recombination protein RAD52